MSARSGSPYLPSAPLLSSTKHILVEGQPAHFYLYTLYAELAHSQLLALRDPLWHGFDDALAYIRRSITPAQKTLTFVTVDPLIYGSSGPRFVQFLNEIGSLSCFGILHRYPADDEQAAKLCEVSPLMAGIIVLAETLAMKLGKLQLKNVHHLPHHPTFANSGTIDRARVRNRLGILPTQVVFSLLGQARRGKGIELVLKALHHVPSHDLKQMFFLIAGATKAILPDKISLELSEKRASYCVDLRLANDAADYATLGEREFGEYLSISDAGLLLYQDEQRLCMSGVAPNYTWNYKPIIALENSIVGQTVVQNDLGVCVKGESALAVAEALTQTLQLVRNGWSPGPAFSAYRAAISPENVLARLAEILGPGSGIVSEHPPPGKNAAPSRAAFVSAIGVGEKGG